jgi:O-antigen/teichoic acid export membrane protein
MIKKFVKDSAIYLIPNLLGRGMSLFLIPLYTQVLSPGDYGVFDLFTLFASLANLIVSLEVNQGIARFYSSSSSIQDKVEYASSALWFTIGMYILFCLLLFFNSDRLAPYILGRDGLEDVYLLGIAHIFLGGLNLLIQNQFKWELRSKTYAVQSMVMLVVTSGASIYLVYFLHWGVKGVIVGQIVGFICSLLFGFINLRTTYSFLFNSEKLKRMLKFSAPLVPASMAVFFMNYSDRLMINHFFSVNELGIYGIAFRISGVVGILLIGVRSALTPLIYANFDKLETKGDLERLFRYFVIGALLFFMTISLLSEWILQVFTSEAFYSAYEFVPILVLGILFSQSYIFMPGASVKKKTKYFLIINTFSAAVNIGLNLILIPVFGLLGVAGATLSAHFISFVCHVFISQKLYFVPHNLFRFVWVLIFAVGAVAGLLNFYEINRVLLVVIVNLSFLIFTFSIGVIQKDELLYIRKLLKK